MDLGFRAFWALYPRKACKMQARLAWLALAPDQELEKRILEAVAEQIQNNWRRTLREQGLTYIPHPATWLHGERWEDDIIPEKLTREQVLDQEYKRLCEEEAS